MDKVTKHFICEECGDRILKKGHCYNPHCSVSKERRIKDIAKNG